MEVGGLKAILSKTLIIIRCEETKNAFLVSKQEVYGKERKRKKKKSKKNKKKELEKQIKGMDSCIHDFGMIFVQEFLGYDC